MQIWVSTGLRGIHRDAVSLFYQPGEGGKKESNYISDPFGSLPVSTCMLSQKSRQHHAALPAVNSHATAGRDDFRHSTDVLLDGVSNYRCWRLDCFFCVEVQSFYCEGGSVCVMFMKQAQVMLHRKVLSDATLA